MVKIRLMRVGKRKQASYRVVVADSRSPRDGRIIEAIGHYHPRTEPSEITIDPARAVHWLERGAQPSNQVRKLLEITGAWAVFRGEAPLSSATSTPTTEAAPAPARKKKVTAAASVEETPEPDAETETPDTDAAASQEGVSTQDNENENVE